MKKERQVAISVSINVTVSPPLVGCFHLLLLKGVTLTASAGTTVRVFLVDQLGIEAGYLANKVQTILFNGKAVDNLDEAVLHEGAVLALSAAMPGLAGAVLRSQGVLRGLRREISLNGQASTTVGGPVGVTVKLFNAVLHDLSPLLLGRGVTVDGKDLLDRLVTCRSELLDGGARLSIDGQPAEIGALDAPAWAQGPVRLTITGIGP